VSVDFINVGLYNEKLKKRHEVEIMLGEREKVKKINKEQKILKAE
jgi:uncharacterized protein (UPF0264 family)